jgi:triphosphatase
MAREIELKFTGTAEALEKLRRSKLLKSHTHGRAKTTDLKSTYFDTSTQELALRGVSLRIRKDGAKLTQTVKSLNGKTAPKWDRAEQDAPVVSLQPEPGVIANAHVRKQLTDWMERGELRPMFETEFKRTAIPLAANGSKIEAAFDFGQIRALGLREGFNTKLAELELELKDGHTQALFDLARQVTKTAPVRFAMETKADRGYALSQGYGDKAVRARPLILEKDMAASDAFAMILGEGLRQIIANENAILRARDVEGVHQMRVAIRRLRSALSAFGKAYAHSEMGRIKTELAWLAGELGVARDWDVFQARILKPVADAFPGDFGVEALTAAARKARRDAWDHVLGEVEGERYRVLMVDIAAAISGKVWEDDAIAGTARSRGKSSPYTRPIEKIARKCLDTRLSRAVALGDRIEELTVTERHELRILLKRLRYAADFLQSCFPEKAAKKYLSSLTRLQDIFGELNDAAMAEGLIAKLTSAEDEPRALLRAGGIVTGWHMALSAKLWASARKRWRKFQSAKQFWR